ncbi:MAG: general secretion pathway protein GspB [Rhodoferax sp.]
MSYILDALKRADAERERGVVPGLYARQVTTPTATPAAGARRSIRLALAAVLALAAIGIGVALWRTAADGPAAASPRAPVAQSPLPALMPPTAPAPAPAPAPAQAASLAVPMPATVPIAAPAPLALAAAPAAVEPAAAPPPRAPASKTSANPAPVLAVPLLAELPEDIRRPIPALNISGAVYSENAGQRLLLVNNLVLSQGSQAAPELTLEEIGAKSSVFSFRGTRFRLAH